jgi:hypothetical protein
MGDIVRNSKGEIITLNALEQKRASYWENHIRNALGYDISITTLTTIVKKVSDQKFFTIAPADYMPVRVGEGAWSDQLTTYRSFNMGDVFETGILNTGSNNARLASADAGVDSLSIKVFNWAKSIGWTLIDLEMASKSGNWDLIAAKERSRKENWDLGIQRVAFLGARGANGSGGQCLGLFNQGSSVNFNTTLLTQSISSLSYTQFNAFATAVVEAYRSNCNRTAYPDRLIVPESDWNGMAGYPSPQFPLKNTKTLLMETFQEITGNPNFKILPCAYGDKTYSGLSTQMYVLLRNDDESVRMDLPVAYTTTLANTFDGFNFQNVGYGEFTGVLAYRPLEMLYFGF